MSERFLLTLKRMAWIGWVSQVGVWGLVAFVIAFGVSVTLTPLITRLANRHDIVDAPDGVRRLHESAVPRLGGVAIYIAIAVAIAVVYSLRPSLIDGRFLSGIAIGTTILAAVGLIDDLRGISPLPKLLGQLLAAGLALTAGFEPKNFAIIYGAGFHLGWLAYPLAIVWIVAVTNAYNLIDGMNGLATGIAVVACGGAVVSALIIGRHDVLVSLLALTGGLVGFLRYNFPRARIFLGDSGTMSIGFLLAMLLVRAGTTRQGVVLTLIPVFALMVPFLDTGLAILRRWLRNVPLYGADARHIHHRLLALGISPARTVVILWALAAVFTAFGLVVSLAPAAVAGILSAGAVLVLTIVVLYGTNLLAYHEFRVARDVLLHGPGRARQAIRERILAMDLCQGIRAAESVDDINAIFRSGAETFGFARMELRWRESEGTSPAMASLADRRATTTAGWRLEFAVRHTILEHSSELTLSIWCDARSSRISGAEHIIRILEPAIADWMRANRPAPPRRAEEAVAPLLADSTIRRAGSSGLRLHS